MMNRNFCRIIFGAMILFLASAVCSCNGRFGATQTSIPIHTGTEGIVVGFAEKTPPSKMYEDSSTPIIILAENRGVYNVQNGIWTLSGDTGIFMFEDEGEGTFSVVGKSKDNPVPGKYYIETRARTLALDSQRQIHSGTITATICYPYETQAGINVCVDTDPLNMGDRKKTCQAATVSGGGGQGGPVSVDSVDVDMIPEGDYTRPEFTIHISNSGGGLVVDPSKTPLACQSSGAPEGLFDTVEVRARLSDITLDCDNKVKLEQGSASVNCVATEPVSRELGSYYSPLAITLKYGYTQSIVAQVQVVRKG